VSTARGLHRYTYADYVAVELQSPTKHEFLDGEIYAMAGGSEEHSALAAEVLRMFGNAVVGRACRVHTSDLRVYVESPGLATFPDGAVICGPFEQHTPSPKATALNPLVLLEVTSDSSEEYDTEEKVRYYQSIPSLRDYVIVSHRERRVTVYSRGDGGDWTAESATAGGQVPVGSIGALLVVDDIYRQSAVA
jgi:Uma2 family endonuclease